MYREMAFGLLNTYLSSVAHRSNEVMKVLTVISSVFVPLTFLAGIYGMNFKNMPELSLRWSYPLVWGVMAATAGSMLWFFWSKGWIGPAQLGERATRPRKADRDCLTSHVLLHDQRPHSRGDDPGQHRAA